MKNHLLVLLLVIVVGGVVTWQLVSGGIGESPASLQSRANAARPNIILIYSDDVDCESLFSTWPEQPADQVRFPALRKLAQNGTIFTNFHVTTPVCGPSRASLLSGQYAHRNQFRVNRPDHRSANGFSGGYRVFDKNHELGLWMKQAGYTTAWVGKYLHDDFSPIEEKRQTWNDILPRGWDQFICVLGGNYRNFAHIGTHHRGFIRNKDQYRTDFEADAVCKVIEEDWADADQPFFLCWAPFAAHLSLDLEQMVADRHNELFADEVSMGVRDMSDFLDLENQPEEMASIPPYASAALDRWTGLHRKRLRAMQALDEGIARMMQSLESSGKLENTLILFTSDHGFSTGQLRHFGKRFPYNRVTRVPFVASGAGVGKGIRCDQLLANIDIAPTLVDMAGGTIPETVDGISFAKLLHAPEAQLDRPAILIENWDRIWSNGTHIDAAFCSWRSPQHIYTEWASGSFEYYDVAADPEQVHNLYPNATASQRQEWSRNLTAERSKNCQMPPVIAREFIYPTTYEERKILSANFQPVEFSGLVESDNGLKQVDLELYCDKIKSYWNGQRWTDQYATMPATLTMPGGHISRWTSSLDTTAIAFDKNERMNRRDVVVHVIATDRKDQQTRWENAFEFKMKINDPQTWIDKPAAWLDKQKPLKISGRAADNFQLDHIQLLVVDLDRNLFWDNEKKQWVKDRVDFDVDLNFDEPSDQPGHWGTWAYEFDGPQEGKIFFCPRAFDADGNFDSSVPFQIVPFEPK